MSLGLLIAAVACLFNFKDCLASILFVAALNYKQMELYHALPFFFYLLGRCILCSSWSQSIGKLATIGITVIATFVIIWLPFLILPMSDDPVLQVCINNIFKIMFQVRVKFRNSTESHTRITAIQNYFMHI